MSELDGVIERALDAASLEVSQDGRGEIGEVRARARRFAHRRRIRRAVGGGLALLVVVVIAAAVVGASTTRRQDWVDGAAFRAVEREGLRIEVPDGWSVEPGPQGGNPALVFWVSARDVGPEAFCDDRGIAADTQLLPTDVIVQVRERTAIAGAPPSPPAEPRPGELDASTMAIADRCRNADARFYRTSFIDHGRQFDVMLVTGDAASHESIALGWEVLNRLEVR